MKDSDISDLSNMACKIAEIYSDKFGAPKTAEWVLLKMTEELGELSGAWLQYQSQARGEATLDDVADELADVLGFLLVFAARTGIDPAQALTQKWVPICPVATGDNCQQVRDCLCTRHDDTRRYSIPLHAV